MPGFGGFGGGGDQQTSQTKLPEWLSRYGHQTANFAAQVANRPFRQYQGQTVAGTNPYQQGAYDWTRDNLGRTQGMMEQYLPGLSALQGFSPEQVQAGQFAGTDMSQYMNPYVQNVVDTSMSAIDRQRQMAMQQQAGQAGQQGAFGGSRHGVADSLTNEAALRQSAETSANLYNQGYQQATGLRMGDIENQLRANLANQQAGISGAGIQMEAGRLGGALAQQAGQAGQQSAAALQASGNALQQQTQQQLTDRQRRWDEMWNYPQQQLNVMLSALQGVPYNQSTVQTGGGGNPFMSGLGGAMIGGSIPGAGMWGAGLGGLAGLMGGFF